MALAVPIPNEPVDRLKRVVFGLRVFGRNVTVRNLRALVHHMRRTRLDGEEVPVAVVLGLTYRCQCACVHCSVESSPDVDTRDEMSTPEIKAVLKEIRDLGVIKVTFFGGEPLAHPDVYDLAGYATRLGLRVAIDTNGILLTEANVAKLKALGVSNVNVSLDSPRREDHNRLRKHPQAYDGALKGLRRLDAVGIPAMLSTYVTSESLHNGDFDQVVEIAREHRAKGVKVLLPMVAGRWHERPDMALSEEDEHMLRERMDPGFVYVEDAFQNVKDQGGAHTCTAVNKSFVYISPKGELQPCPAVPVRFASLTTETLRSAINRMWGHKAFEAKCGICAMNEPDFRRRVGLPLPGEGDGHRLVDAELPPAAR